MTKFFKKSKNLLKAILGPFSKIWAKLNSSCLPSCKISEKIIPEKNAKLTDGRPVREEKRTNNGNFIGTSVRLDPIRNHLQISIQRSGELTSYFPREIIRKPGVFFMISRGIELN